MPSLNWKPPYRRPGAFNHLATKPTTDGKNIFGLIDTPNLQNYLSWDHHQKWEQEIGQPALEKKGYRVKRWYTVDRNDKVRLLTRGVVVTQVVDDVEQPEQFFYCLPVFRQH